MIFKISINHIYQTIVFNDIFSKTYSFIFAGHLQITGTCYGTYDNDQNEITTPNYPSVYPGSKRCNWNIEVTQGKTIELEFEAFRLEAHANCAYDWIQIFDGGSSSSSDLTGKLCGTRKPSNTRSTGNRLFLTWRSDSSGAYSGFKISAKLAGK